MKDRILIVRMPIVLKVTALIPLYCPVKLYCIYPLNDADSLESHSHKI